MPARTRKTDYASTGYKHREHRSFSGRTKDYKRQRHRRGVSREIQLWVERKQRKFKRHLIKLIHEASSYRFRRSGKRNSKDTQL